MTDLTSSSRAASTFLSRIFFEKLLIAAAIPIWLGIAVLLHWIDNPQEFYVIFLIIYSVLIILLFIARYVKTTPIISQVGFLIFVGVPLTVLLIYSVFIVFPSPSSVIPTNDHVFGLEAYLADFLRYVFIVLCLLLPGGLYYQFGGSRRDSLLDSFIVIIDRLGLFDHRKLFQSPAFVSTGVETVASKPGRAAYITESEFSRARRIHSYFERFEAIYGPLAVGFISEIVEKTKPSVKAEPIQRFSASTDIPLSIRQMAPVILLLGLSFVGWISILPPVHSAELAVFPYIFPTPTTIGFAFLGSYFFTLQYLVWRFIRKDLTSNAYVSMSLRMILSLIGVYVLGQLFDAGNIVSSTTVRNCIAFCVGAFPMIMWEMLSALAKNIWDEHCPL
jgi:hypothetical protein